MTPPRTKAFLSLIEVVTLHAFGTPMDIYAYHLFLEEGESERLEQQFARSFQAVVEAGKVGEIRGIGKRRGSTAPEEILPIVFHRKWGAFAAVLDWLELDETSGSIPSSEWDRWEDVEFRTDGVSAWLGVAQPTILNREQPQNSNARRGLGANGAAPKKRHAGRTPGSGAYNDSKPIEAMQRLIDSDDAKSPHQAAGMVVDDPSIRVKGTNRPSKIRRLWGKHKELEAKKSWS